MHEPNPYKDETVIYQEKIFSPFNFILSLLLFLLTIGVITKAHDFSSGPVSPVLTGVLIFLSIFFLFILINFSVLMIRITRQTLTVRYGIFYCRYSLMDIEGASVDNRSALSYGGWGLRMARHKGKRLLVYSLLRVPRVSVQLKNKRFDELIFSTQNPDEVIRIIGRKS